MKKRTAFHLTVFWFASCAVWGQSKGSKGDAYFFQYDYAQAITAYENEQASGELSPQQQLNLADAYFKTNAFRKASKVYFVAFKNDSLLHNSYFNKMLQSFAKTNEKERIPAFLAARASSLGKELVENADFNIELLQSNASGELDFEIFNVESNGPNSDFSPSFFENKLLFSSGRPQEKRRSYAPMAESYLDIYVGRINGGGQILNPNPFDGVSKSPYHKATPYYSQGLNSIFYVRSNTNGNELAFDGNGKNTLAIGMQKLEGDFKMLLRDLSTSFYYPFYDENTGKLYFAADFGDGYGGTDIYFMYTNKGQIMSAPINLGPRINSPGNEIAPYIFENSLYFSSDVFYGLGGMDIYRSNIEDKENFSIPVNLGMGVNSPKDDFGFIMRDEGEGLLGYFSSNREGGKGKDDIYGFKVAQKPGLKTLTLKGSITNPNSKFTKISEAMVRVMDSTGSLIKEVRSEADGSYRIEIPWRNTVVFQVEKKRHALHTEKLEFLTGPDQETTFNTDIGLAYYNDLVQEKEDQTVIKMNKFYFDRGKAKITDAIAKELESVIYFVKSFPAAQLRIETYTDSRGGSSTNFRLTQSRSDAIKKYLTDKGVPSSSILYSVGYGEQKLLNNCHNGAYCIELMHRQNQRSLVVVLNDNVLFE